MHPIRLSLAGVFALATLLPTAAAVAQDIEPSPYAQLKGRHIGPLGNRVSTVAGVVGDPMTYYGGAASGGVWKTTDGGLTWEPIFDDQDVHSIGSIAVAPSDPNVVWVGTGEAFIRSNVSIGNGVYRSTDGGKTWEHKGLDSSGRIGRIVVHPTNPDVAYAAVLGHAYSPQPDRGVFRTTDGGDTWEHVLTVDENTGASDLVMDPNNPRILFAGMWQVMLRTWTRESGGPGSGLHMTRDGGDTWTRLEGSDLPTLPVGKIAVCMTPENSNRIYALIETGDGVPWHGQETESGELWRSDDGGTEWQLVSHNRNFAGRTAYYSRCAVAPDDPDEAYFVAAGFAYTKDGGSTSESANFFGGESGGIAAPGWDHHDMWIDPTNADRMIVGHDGGLSISQNRGASWLRVQLPVAQMYHVTVDNQIPYYVMGNRQDGPSMRGPSNTRSGGLFGGGIPRGAWHDVGGGESGFATPDPVDPNIVWSSASGFGALGGVVVRWDARTGHFRQVEVWPDFTAGLTAADVRYRFQWTFPLLISPHDNKTVFVTSQHVHRTSNGGQSWDVISPDLTTNDSTMMGISGGLTPDNLGVEYCCVIYAFEESPVQQGVYWTGSSDGLVHVSQDAGGTWDNVTGNIPDLPPLGTVRNIDASKWDAGKAYITIDFHEVGNFAPYVYKTDNFGRSWRKITDGIADSPVSYARNIREDPVRPGLLYLGTESALYVSFDDGEEWKPLKLNLPPAPMYWLAVQEHFLSTPLSVARSRARAQRRLGDDRAGPARRPDDRCDRRAARRRKLPRDPGRRRYDRAAPGAGEDDSPHREGHEKGRGDRAGPRSRPGRSGRSQWASPVGAANVGRRTGARADDAGAARGARAPGTVSEGCRGQQLEAQQRLGHESQRPPSERLCPLHLVQGRRRSYMDAEVGIRRQHRCACRQPVQLPEGCRRFHVDPHRRFRKRPFVTPRSATWVSESLGINCHPSRTEPFP